MSTAKAILFSQGFLSQPNIFNASLNKMPAKPAKVSEVTAENIPLNVIVHIMTLRLLHFFFPVEYFAHERCLTGYIRNQCPLLEK